MRIKPEITLVRATTCHSFKLLLLLLHRYLSILLQFCVILWYHLLIYHLMGWKIHYWILVLRLCIWLILNVWIQSNWLPWILRICSIDFISLTIVSMMHTVLWSIPLRSIKIILSTSSLSTSVRSLSLVPLSLLVLSVISIVLLWCFFVFLMSFVFYISIILV